MAATVFGTARFGVVDDSAVTDLHVASLSYTYASEQARGKDSQGFSIALSLTDDSTEISLSGVVAVKATGFTPAIGDTLVLLNESADSLSLNDQNLFSTATGNAGTVVTGGSLERTNTDFETGDLTLLFLPLVVLSYRKMNEKLNKRTTDIQHGRH